MSQPRPLTKEGYYLLFAGKHPVASGIAFGRYVGIPSLQGLHSTPLKIRKRGFSFLPGDPPVTLGGFLVKAAETESLRPTGPILPKTCDPPSLPPCHLVTHAR
jgi:hypothetical protein